MGESFGVYVGDEFVDVGTADELAKTYGTSPKVIRRLATPEARELTPITKPRFYRLGDYEPVERSPNAPHMNRDLVMARLRDEGTPVGEICEMFGLSRTRVESALARVDGGRYEERGIHGTALQ